MKKHWAPLRSIVKIEAATVKSGYRLGTIRFFFAAIVGRASLILLIRMSLYISLTLGLLSPVVTAKAASLFDKQAGQNAALENATDQQRAAEAAARAAMERPLGDFQKAQEQPAMTSATQPVPDKSKSSGHGVMNVILTIIMALMAVAGVVFYLKTRSVSLPVPVENPQIRAKFTGPALPNVHADGPVGANLVNAHFMDLAVENHLITTGERANLAARFRGNDYAAMLFLAEQRPVSKALIGKLWGDSLELAYVDPTKTIIQYDLLEKLPKGYAEKHGVIPLYAIGEAVTVAMADPVNKDYQRHMEERLGTFVSPVFAFPDQINAALEIARISLRSLTDLLQGEMVDAGRAGAELSLLAEAESMAEFTRGLFLLALKQRASDIHIEPTESDVFIRLRIDGALQPCLRLSMRFFPSLSNVIKILAGADIGERRRPQDGHITLNLPDRALEFRFSSVPTIYGEKIVLRLLGQNQFASVPSLDDLDFSKIILDGIRRIIEAPNGVFFVTGPTGSGKTTTLYAALKDLNRKDLNIMTIEDPVEYRLSGINQVQVNAPAGVTFATALRSFLRQDPDVILVGEIRDLETAKIAAQAALTGHLVLTTMHTNNALQAITRLIQIGVEPFLVAPSIIGVMAQRLVRKLCDHCKEKYALTPEEINALFINWDGRTPVHFYRAKGCEHCNFIGYFGRLAIHELFVIDDEVRNFIAHNATILDIQNYADTHGFTTMSYDGIKKVLRGLTTMDEVTQATVLNE